MVSLPVARLRAALPSRLCLLVLVSLVARGVLLGVEVVDKDEASYRVAALEMLRGGTLYVDVADHHPPGAYAFYALAEATLGLGMPGVRLLALLAVVPLTAFMLSAFFEHDRRGLVAALTYVVYGAAFIGHDMLAVNCEVLMLLPACAALVVVRDATRADRPARLALAGALLGLAVLFKYQAGLWLPAVALAAAPTSWRARDLARRAAGAIALAGGFALPLLLTWFWFHARGAGGAFLYWNVTHNLSYARNPIGVGEALERAAASLFPFLLVTGLLWLAAWRSRARFDAYRIRLLVGLLAGGLFAGALGLRFYAHYFIQLYPPLALLASPWLSDVLAAPLQRAGRVALALTALLWTAFTGANAWLYYGTTDVYSETWPGAGTVGEWLRRDPCSPGATLFVWGYAPGLYTAAGLRPATRFLFVEATLVGYVPGNTGSAVAAAPAQGLVRPEHWDWLMSDLERNRPAFILDTAPGRALRWSNFPITRFPRLLGFVRERYAYAARLEGVDIWRRRDCPPAR